MKKSVSQTGFTLAELLVVIVVLGLLAGIATPQVFRLMSGAKSDSAALQVEALSAGLELYAIQIGDYPTEQQGLLALWNAPEGKAGQWEGPYIRKEESLTDPWGVLFVYRSPGTIGPFDLLSLGADQREGGTGSDADIVFQAR